MPNENSKWFSIRKKINILPNILEAECACMCFLVVIELSPVLIACFVRLNFFHFKFGNCICAGSGKGENKHENCSFSLFFKRILFSFQKMFVNTSDRHPQGPLLAAATATENTRANKHAIGGQISNSGIALDDTLPIHFLEQQLPLPHADEVLDEENFGLEVTSEEVVTSSPNNTLKSHYTDDNAAMLNEVI